jgi:hypothetical protein
MDLLEQSTFADPLETELPWTVGLLFRSFNMQMFTYFGKPNENIQNAYKLARNMTGLSL